MKLKLNPCLRLDWAPPYRCELPLERASLSLEDPALLRLLLRLDGPQEEESLAALVSRIGGVSASLARRRIARLRDRSVLVPADYDPPAAAAARAWIERGWMQALFVHRAKDGPRSAQPRQRPLSAARGIALPAAGGLPEGAELERLLLRRRSGEPMTRARMASGELAGILGQAREVPAEGLTLFCFAFKVDGVPSGLYRYNRERHSLGLVRRGDLRPALRALAMGQSEIGSACFAVAMASRWEERALCPGGGARLRDTQTAMGRLAHRFQLMATWLGFSTYLTCGLRYPDQARRLGISYRREGIDYMMAAG